MRATSTGRFFPLHPTYSSAPTHFIRQQWARYWQKQSLLGRARPAEQAYPAGITPNHIVFKRFLLLIQLSIYQVDAFAEKVFTGNPAAVCPLAHWLDDATLLRIAQENNLSATAFYVRQGTQVAIRWFTPAVEIDLCGHATLATAYVLFHRQEVAGDHLVLHAARSGPLRVTRAGELLTLDFPVDTVVPVEVPAWAEAVCQARPRAAFRGKTDYMFIFENQAMVQTLQPDVALLKQVPARGLIVTAPGEQTDFVYRFFAPAIGTNEDPVCGSAHTTMVPYWAAQLGKTHLTAAALSQRTGLLQCQALGERVAFGGRAQLYLEGTIYL